MITSGSSSNHVLAPTGGSLSVALVDDDATSRILMRHWLEQAGYRSVEITSAPDTARLLASPPNVICIDLSFAQGEGRNLLSQFVSELPQVPVVAVAVKRDAESAVEIMKAGAFDYLSRPLDKERFLLSLQRACERSALYRNVRRLERELADRTLSGPMGGHSETIVQLDGEVARIINGDVAVCLIGEEGSGKEQVAQAIHEKGGRCHAPLVRFDCAAVGPEEHECGLFGEEQAVPARRCGAIEQASGGVLLIQHVDRLSLKAQAALAATLANRRIRRVGGSMEIAANARLVSASLRDLRPLVDEGRFREDLYFRLVVYPVEVPPLRRRRDDIPLLASYYLREHFPQTPRHFSPEALETLMRYDWPGNLSELENVVQRTALVAQDNVIGLLDLPEQLRRPAPEDDDTLRHSTDIGRYLSFPEDRIIPLRDLEKIAIEHALRVTHGSVSQAAQRLGIGRATLYRRIASFDLTQSVA